MKSRSFAPRGELYHRKWLSDVLDIPYSETGGIDLSDDSIGIEVKCRYEEYDHTFTIHHYQIDRFSEENSDKELFWAFLLYGLTVRPKSIRNHNIEKLINKRTVWFLDWDWVKQFPVSCPKTGPYVYVKEMFFPDNDEFSEFTRNGGTLYLPKDSILEERFISNSD